jgi:hypothetical protein
MASTQVFLPSINPKHPEFVCGLLGLSDMSPNFTNEFINSCHQWHNYLLYSRLFVFFLKEVLILSRGPWDFILLWFHFAISLRFLPPWRNACGMLWPKRWPVEYSPDSHLRRPQWSWLCCAWRQHLSCGRLQLEYGTCPHLSHPFFCCFSTNVSSFTHVPFKNMFMCQQ